MKTTVYQIVTDRIIEKLENGVVPWRQMWTNYLDGTGAPQNFKSKRPYRGINTMLLSCQGYKSPFWLSYKQATELGGQVRKGQKGTPVVFWLWSEDKETGKKHAAARYYTVFNLEQIDGIEMPKLEPKQSTEQERIEECEAIVRYMPRKPIIEHRESAAYYRSDSDIVNMPRFESFKTREAYYSVLFHELGHSTGHKSRLNRSTLTANVKFGTETYSKEELVAELCSAFVCADVGIENATLDQSASYLKGWIDALRGDSRLIMSAASQAQKAADWILNDVEELPEQVEAE